ncbi:LysM peptidoglycan-binding domain-containing protein [Candidatus Gracilibacteria bacterium]|nr:LysM peptidoglycan-binding domain-containing protein [Candidatus Gracilibacteria bacterium]
MRIIGQALTQNTHTKKRVLSRKKRLAYQIGLFLFLFSLPIYPRFASSLYETTQYDFYRGNIDESSIIGSYIGSDEFEDAPLLESSNSFLSVNTILDDDRDISGTNEVVQYEVKSGDSFYSIAYDFNISANSIYWANNFSKNHTLQPGDIIQVPPVSGLIHIVKSGETIGGIAKKYEQPASKILEQNLLTSSADLKIGQQLVIPGAIKKVVPKPVARRTTLTTSRSTSSNAGGYSFAKYANSQYVSPGGKFQLQWHKPYSGVPGNCTWYVASYKNVDWRGNANQWIRNAKSKGHLTGSTPRIGSIVAFEGRGYNPRYGHVGIVMDIKGNDIIVSDMNYRRPYEVTYRKVPSNDRSITGYIYVD